MNEQQVGVSVGEADRKLEETKEMTEILAPGSTSKQPNVMTKLIISLCTGVIVIVVNMLDPITETIIGGLSENGKKTFKGHLVTGLIVAIVVLLSMFVF